jgi:predicted nucleic acid-binding protein
MHYLFDSDAISESFKKRPQPEFLDWLRGVGGPRRYTSAVVIGELYEGAYYKAATEGRYFHNIQENILPSLTVLPFDSAAAEVYGRVAAALDRAGRTIEDIDIQVAATALLHDLVLVTGNLRHFTRIPGLRIDTILAEARASRN